jgi:1-acyl-sn-glycerol-3-phosphate acyltransferase
MRDRIPKRGETPGFWPPRHSALWVSLLTPLHRRMLHRHHGITDVIIEGLDRLAKLGPADGVLVCPNHSYTGDGSVMMEVSRRAPRPLHIMAAYHVFQGHRGIDGWLLQRAGAFSVDREGCDRRAIRTATELLATGKAVVIFPEGEIYHTNEKLTPLREGVAFMAVTAQRDLDKAKSPARVWLMPTAIRYQFIGDVVPALDRSLAALEARLLLKPRHGAPLHERILRFGEMMLTLKEKEHLGRSYDDEGETLPGRLGRLINALLERLETAHLGRTNAGETVPVRVKLLRQKLLEAMCEEDVTIDVSAAARGALDDVHLVLQLYSYPGDYISTRPSIERMAETIEKFEEDVTGTYAPPTGRRRATVVFGEAIDVKAHLGAGKPRAAATDLTAKLEASIQSIMSQRPTA